MDRICHPLPFLVSTIAVSAYLLYQMPLEAFLGRTSVRGLRGTDLPETWLIDRTDVERTLPNPAG
jgi:hypothetical protein